MKLIFFSIIFLDVHLFGFGSFLGLINDGTSDDINEDMIYATNILKCSHTEDFPNAIDVSGVNIDFQDFCNKFAESFLIDAAASGILKVPGFKETNKFVVVVPGYISGITLKSDELIEGSFAGFFDTYLMVLHDLLYTNSLPDSVTSYERSVTYVYYIGKALANILITLVNNGVCPENIHLIGHSLGAHIVGNAGQIFYEQTGQKVSRITGLDPAGPCYEDIQYQLRSGQADFVDIYHCNCNVYGTSYFLGDVDFVVNNGASQPGCDIPLILGIDITLTTDCCSHMACQNFYFLTVSQPALFQGYKCSSYQMFEDGMCNNNAKTIAGFWTPNNVTGTYYLSTTGSDISVEV